VKPAAIYSSLREHRLKELAKLGNVKEFQDGDNKSGMVALSTVSRG
jgi:uncharacterized protein YkvS